MNEIYSKDGCVYCVKAKALLENRGEMYVEYKIGDNYTLEEFMEKFPGVKTVPQIIYEGEHVGGYDQLAEKMKG